MDAIAQKSSFSSVAGVLGRAWAFVKGPVPKVEILGLSPATGDFYSTLGDIRAEEQAAQDAWEQEFRDDLAMRVSR